MVGAGRSLRAEGRAVTEDFTDSCYPKAGLSSVLRFLLFTPLTLLTGREQSLRPLFYMFYRFANTQRGSQLHPQDEIHVSPTQNDLCTTDLPISDTAISELPLPRQALTTVLGPKIWNDDVLIC